MPRDIDFSRLRLQDALDLAILIEDEAEERYVELAEQMEMYQTPEAGQFFRAMAVNESKHGRDLRARRKQLFGDAPAVVDRSMIWDVEAPTYDRVRAFMSPRQALGVAMESECKAHDYFVSALPHITDPDVRALFEELRQEETEHKELVSKELDKLPPDSDIDPEKRVDEPPAL